MEETRGVTAEVRQKPEEWYRQVNYEDSREETEQYEKTWERILKGPLRRTWEHYLVEEKG